MIHLKFKTKKIIKRFIGSGFLVFGYVIRLLSNENRNLPCSRIISFIEMLVMFAKTCLFSLPVPDTNCDDNCFNKMQIS